jgi:hypothetical protein
VRTDSIQRKLLHIGQVPSRLGEAQGRLRLERQGVGRWSMLDKGALHCGVPQFGKGLSAQEGGARGNLVLRIEL